MEEYEYDIIEDEDIDNNYENADYDETDIDDLSDDENDNILEEDDEEKINPLNSLKTKKKGMYFDEELVSHLIIDEYQPKLVYGINEKGKRVCIDRSNAPKDIEREIMANLLLIANAIINKYKYWKFEPVDDLQEEALKAMWAYLPNFTPGKGTTFNLFSIICKRHLLNYTLKNYKHRKITNIDAYFDIEGTQDINYNLFFEDLERTFTHIINTHYIGEQRKKYIELTSILMEYLDKNKKVVGKNDLLSLFKEYGYKSTEYKNFIKEMSQYKEDFYEICKKEF